jgi:hypothetical protein
MWCIRHKNGCGNYLQRYLQLLGVCLALGIPFAAFAVDAQEGLWEIGLVMRVEGKDYGPYTRQQCVTKADAQDPSRLFAETTGSCEYTNKRYFGSQFSFNVRCNTDIPLSGTGQVEYGADWVKGNMALSAQVADGPSVETASEISGKRLGKCQ